MDNRSIDILDIARPDAKHGTTHVHAYVRAANGWYILYVCPYSREDATGLEGIRRYPLAAGRAHGIEPCGRFSTKRLAALAADPNTLNIARALAGME